jgi:hypothetical protein
MAEARDRESIGANLTWSVPSVVGTPLLAVLTDINGKLLESVASAQKDWVEFVHQRVKEDFAVSQQLLSCRSVSDMQSIYSRYIRTAFEHYREQSEKAVQRGKLTTEDVAQTMESAQQMRH